MFSHGRNCFLSVICSSEYGEIHHVRTGLAGRMEVREMFGRPLVRWTPSILILQGSRVKVQEFHWGYNLLRPLVSGFWISSALEVDCFWRVKRRTLLVFGFRLLFFFFPDGPAVLAVPCASANISASSSESSSPRLSSSSFSTADVIADDCLVVLGSISICAAVRSVGDLRLHAGEISERCDMD